MHPSLSDFFRTMESQGGEDLSYFWRGWYFNNWQLYMAVTGSDTHTFTVTITLRAMQATIDPDHTLPDVDRKNNTTAVR